MTAVSEVHAYVHILRELTGKKGWKDAKIYTQNECHNDKRLKEQLKGGVPENIVAIGANSFYVIEAKSRRKELPVAIKEATEYSDSINESPTIKALFCTGIAGNPEEGYVATSRYFVNGSWVVITENGSEVTGLLSKMEVEQVQNFNDPNLKDVEISEEDFLRTAEEINGILHENAIHKDARAKFISALLLALSTKPDIPLDLTPPELVAAINARVDLVLQREGKPDFGRYIHIELPSSEDNHIKLKNAIIKTVQELLGLNIHSAMKSGKDVLGKFYEVFLKYGNGAKEIGIVLTPRHITRMAAEVMDIQANDIVFDPTCGAGGFLVAGFDEVRKKAQGAAFEKFRKFGLYGIEEQDTIVALALVNMIFRGDGKNNIIEGNCFRKWLGLGNDGKVEWANEDSEGRVPPITKTMMNPPFPKKKTDIKEYRFIDQALAQMQEGGTLFSVLPYSCMIKGGAFLAWRKKLLAENTLLSVVTFPAELFSPIGVRTVGVFIKKGVSQGKTRVLWLRALYDGLRLKKGKRLPHPQEPDDIEAFKPLLKAYLASPDTKVENVPQLQKATEVDYSDKALELCPEQYLDQPPPTSAEVQKEAERLVRESYAFLIRSGKEEMLVAHN